jgi:signal transduction histidine kinase
VIGYTCFGLLAVVLSTIYVAAGAWGLAAFAIPLLLSRQMFVHWKEVAETSVRLSHAKKALTAVSNRIGDERREERLAVAAGIHDEVLGPLHKVHLMGQVLRQDLAHGRLLDLEADLPDLVQATEQASAALRDLVRDLRRSTIGPGGLPATLELLARDVQASSGIHVDVRVEAVAGSPLTHLLLFQVAREALANVVRHSGAQQARLVLENLGDGVRLVIEDDGAGFREMLVDRNEHFGLQLMRERVELAGGSLLVDTEMGRGTRIIAQVPVDRGP